MTSNRSAASGDGLPRWESVSLSWDSLPWGRWRSRRWSRPCSSGLCCWRAAWPKPSHFWCRAWSGFFYHLLGGLLSAVVGLLFLTAPVDALLTLTLLLTVMLLVGGIFNIVAAVSYRFSGWGMLLLRGVIDIVLGIMIWQTWPAAALWVIGLFVGINLIFRGVNWLGLGLALRTMPRTAAA